MWWEGEVLVKNEGSTSRLPCWAGQCFPPFLLATIRIINRNFQYRETPELSPGPCSGHQGALFWLLRCSSYISVSVWVDGQTEMRRKEREILCPWGPRYQFPRWGLKCWCGVVEDTGVRDLQAVFRSAYFSVCYLIISTCNAKIPRKSVLSAPWSGSLEPRTLVCWQRTGMGCA